MVKKATLLAGLYTGAAMSAMSEITNPYDGLPEMRYNGSQQSKRKTQLTKKQNKKGLRLSLHVKLVRSSVIRLAKNGKALGKAGICSTTAC